MAETVLGFPDLIEVGHRIIEDPSRGVQVERHYEGTHEAVEAGRQSLKDSTLYRDADFTTGTPKARLIVRTPDYGDGETDNFVVTTWELTNNHSNRSGYEHSKSTEIGEAIIQRMKKAIKRGTETAPEGMTSGDAGTLWEHMVHGQDTFFAPQAVFKLTHIISRRGTVGISYSNVGRVRTSAQVIAESGASVIYQDAIHGAFNTYPFGTPTGFTLGWLKMFPNFNNVSGGRVAVTIEYFLDAWSNYYYTP